ncbi:COG1470 family protein [Laspinema olomoucense]|uniref:COG1470 family protein n=1 Tax=Laspinema olomoucense TaxID=3231600 RepID=UPI0021BB95A4|nr:transcriptional regulator [Laspinema sp. D3a]MCT7989854.1 transcriptional regulator [Laspinema sp. D3a]
MVMQGYSPKSGQIVNGFEDNNGDRLMIRPIGIILNPAGVALVTAGEVLELTATITNQGSVSAIIDVFIAETSQPVHQWFICPRERLALSPGQASEVVFQVQIPVDAIPGTYDYTLVIDAPQHYPEETPIDQKVRLQVMPFIQEARTVSDPTFTLQPPTSSVSPALLQPGQPLELQVTVHNRSDRVDRFFLTCPDLESRWFTIIYPEGFQQAGMAIASEGLELNPGDIGQILLFISPPPDTWAGVYAPTIRVYSANNPNLALLDVVYLQIAPLHLVTVELLSLVAKIKREAGLFELRLSNQGNVIREIAIHAKGTDEEDICTYTITPPVVRILPGTSVTVGVSVKPTKGWRPFFGRMINFSIELEDLQQFPLINDRFQASVFWEPRPWWQFLPIVILMSASVAALIFLIWWLLTRPPVRAQVMQFSPESNSYQELNNEAIRLNWTISNPNHLKTVTVVGFSPDGRVRSGPFIYELTPGLPNALDRFCTQGEQLICRNVWTDAREAGDYVFELSAIPINPKAETQTIRTNPIRILPVPEPKIEELSSTQPVYQERLLSPGTPANPPQSNPRATQTATQSNRILLNWTLSHPDQIQQINLLGLGPDGTVKSVEKRYNFAEGIPEELREFCSEIPASRQVICANVPTDAIQPGDYIFHLTVIPKKGQPEQLETRRTNTIKILAQKIPTRIVEFTFNGQPAPPKLVRQANPKQTSLMISWKVEGGNGMKVELLPAPGTVPREGRMPYPVSQQAGSETITLSVTDEEGNQQQRSVIIETLAPPPPPEIVEVPPPPAVEQAPAMVPTPGVAAGAEGNPAAAPAPGTPEAALVIPAPPTPGGDAVPPPPGELPVPGANLPAGVDPAAPGGTPDGAPDAAEEPPKEPGPKFFETQPLAPAELPPQFN